MIPVTPAPEPADFDGKVRRPGLLAIAELAGEKPLRSRGRRHEAVATRRGDISPSKFPPYWRDALGDMLDSYGRLCAYLALRIPKGTGAPSVDHMIPKSTDWRRVYEWDNYRLACSRMNACKGVVGTVLDPFLIKTGWFALELVAFQVIPGDRLSKKIRSEVEQTIATLRLSDPECCDARAEYADRYWNKGLPFSFLESDAPFVARELKRQGRLKP